MVDEFIRQEYDEMCERWTAFAADAEDRVRMRGIRHIFQAEDLLITAAEIKRQLNELLSVATEERLDTVRLVLARALAERFGSLEAGLREARNNLLAEHAA